MSTRDESYTDPVLLFLCLIIIVRNSFAVKWKATTSSSMYRASGARGGLNMRLRVDAYKKASERMKKKGEGRQSRKNRNPSGAMYESSN